MHNKVQHESRNANWNILKMEKIYHVKILKNWGKNVKVKEMNENQKTRKEKLNGKKISKTEKVKKWKWKNVQFAN